MVTTVLGADGVLLPLSGSSTKGFVGLKGVADLLVGTIGNDVFRGGGGGDTLIGGLGDDTYYVYDVRDTVTELAGQGIDTIWATVNYLLPANVENLTVSTDQTYGGGNSLNNIINGGAGFQTLNGMGGNDVLTGGAGADIFVLGSGGGHDVVTDFQNGVDKARLWGLGLDTFSQVQSAMTQTGADVMVKAATGEELIFRNHHVSDFTAQDFQLGIDTSQLRPTFDDEFNTLSLYSQGGTWWTALGSGNSINTHTLTSHGESEIYVDPTFTGTGNTPLGVNPFSISNGVLNISADVASPAVSSQIWGYKYTSGILETKTTFAQQYGYFEARMKLPPGNGLWPAFWLVPSNLTTKSEIDVMEQVGRDPSTVFQTSHTSTGGPNISVPVHIDNPDQFHTYGVMWDQNWLVYYVDGVETSRRVTAPDQQLPMYMILNLAVGGYWPGYPDATTQFPATMQVDYIHVFQLKGVGLTAGADAYAVNPGALLTVSAASGVLANDSDPSGQTFATMLVSGPSHGTLSLAADGSFTYDPNAGYVGADSFTYRANDGMQQSLNTNVSLTVGAPDMAPVAVAGAAATNEDTLLSGRVSATDPDSPALTYALVTGPQHGSLTFNPDGTYTYTPAAHYNGSDSFSFKANDGQLDSNIATISLTVASVNDAPAALASSVTFTEDSSVVFSPTDFQFSDSHDSPANGLAAVVIAALPGAGTLYYNGAPAALGQSVSVADLTAGKLNYTPGTYGWGTGYASFSFQVQDSGGTANGGQDTSPAAGVMTLNVTHVNHAPTVVSEAAIASTSGSVSFTIAELLANASDVDHDTLGVPSVAMGTNPHGTVQLTAGLVTYTPDVGYNGSDSFTYTVSDGQAGASGTVNVAVSAMASGYLIGTAGNDAFDLSARLNPQLVSGQAGNDTIVGGAGADSLNGGSGNDVINGGGGADNITGGPATDIMTGGAGADTFVFTAVTDFGSVGQEDVITDFSRADGDKIRLTTIDANTLLAGDQAFSWLGTGAFSHQPGELHYTVAGPDLMVSGDMNGDGLADFQFKVLAASSLQASDFFL